MTQVVDRLTTIALIIIMIVTIGAGIYAVSQYDDAVPIQGRIVQKFEMLTTGSASHHGIIVESHEQVTAINVNRAVWFSVAVGDNCIFSGSTAYHDYSKVECEVKE